MTNIGTRIKNLAAERDMTISDLAKKAGLSRHVVYTWIRGDRTPEPKSIRKFADALGVPESVITGEIAEGDFANLTAPLEGNGGYPFVRRISVRFSAGPGAEPLVEEEELYPVPPEVLARHRTRPERCRITSVMGDSMEPTLHDGDDILFIEEPCPECVEIRDGKIYVFFDGSGLRVKRLSRQGDGRIRIRSDNPVYKEEEIPPERQEYVRIYGRVIWSGHCFD